MTELYREAEVRVNRYLRELAAYGIGPGQKAMRRRRLREILPMTGQKEIFIENGLNGTVVRVWEDGGDVKVGILPRGMFLKAYRDGLKNTKGGKD